MNTIPRQTPIHQKLAGDVEFEGEIGQRLGVRVAEKIRIGGVDVPCELYGRLAERSASYGSIQSRVDEKPLFLRGRFTGQGAEWFGLVTDQFEELPLDQADCILGTVGRRGEVRYDADKERFIVNYLLTRMPTLNGRSVGLNFFVDSGDYGMYGGNGRMAMRTGVSVHDGECLNWTRFMDSGIDRIIHRVDEWRVGDVIDLLYGLAEQVQEKWKQGSDVVLEPAVLAGYAAEYGSKVGAKRVFERAFGSEGLSAYDAAFRLTQEAQGVGAATQLKLETLAGELIMHPQEIRQRYLV